MSPAWRARWRRAVLVVASPPSRIAPIVCRAVISPVRLSSGGHPVG